MKRSLNPTLFLTLGAAIFCGCGEDAPLTSASDDEEANDEETEDDETEDDETEDDETEDDGLSISDEADASTDDDDNADDTDDEDADDTDDETEEAETPVLDEWRESEAMPITPAAFTQAVALDGKLFVMGGRTLNEGSMAGQAVFDIAAYDPDTEEWTEHEPLPEALDQPNIAGWDDSIYVLGAKGSREVYRYDINNRAWENIGTRPVDAGIGSSGVAVDDGKIYVVAGLVPSPTNERGARLTDFAVFDTDSESWEDLPDAPVENAFFGTAIVDSVLYTSGGSTELGDVARRGQTFAYDFETEEWTEKALMPVPVSSLGTAAVGHRIYFIGGIAGSTGRINPDLQIYDTESDSWEFGEPMLTPRFAIGTAKLDDEIYVAGGVMQTGEVDFDAVDLVEVLGL